MHIRNNARPKDVLFKCVIHGKYNMGYIVFYECRFSNKEYILVVVTTLIECCGLLITKFRSLNYAWMSKLGHVGEIEYAYGNEVLVVLLNWLGSTLDSRNLLGDDYTTSVAMVLSNQELHALSHSNRHYHQIFLTRSNQYETLFFFCED
jgi:hypothetical protein